MHMDKWTYGQLNMEFDLQSLFGLHTDEKENEFSYERRINNRLCEQRVYILNRLLILLRSPAGRILGSIQFIIYLSRVLCLCVCVCVSQFVYHCLSLN